MPVTVPVATRRDTGGRGGGKGRPATGVGRTGFTIELVEEVAKRQGWSIHYLDTDNVGAQLTAVADGRADFGAGAISITSERRQSFDFSQPMFNAGLQIMVPHHSSKPSPPNVLNFLPLLSPATVMGPV